MGQRRRNVRNSPNHQGANLDVRILRKRHLEQQVKEYQTIQDRVRAARYFPRWNGIKVAKGLPPAGAPAKERQEWFLKVLRHTDPSEFVVLPVSKRQIASRYWVGPEVKHILPLNYVREIPATDEKEEQVQVRVYAYSELLEMLERHTTDGIGPGGVRFHVAPLVHNDPTLRGEAFLGLGKSDETLVVVGRSRVGKTTGALVLTIVFRRGPSLVVDARTDLQQHTLKASITKAYLANKKSSKNGTTEKKGGVYQLVRSKQERDQIHALLDGNEDVLRPRCMDLTMGCEDYAHAVRVANAIVTASITDKHSNHWIKAAQSMLAPLLFLAAVSGEGQALLARVGREGLRNDSSDGEKRAVAWEINHALKRIADGLCSDDLDPNMPNVRYMLDQVISAQFDWGRVFGMDAPKEAQSEEDKKITEIMNASEGEGLSMISTVMSILSEMGKHANSTETVAKLSQEELLDALAHESTFYLTLPTEDADQANGIFAGIPLTYQQMWKRVKPKWGHSLGITVDEMPSSFRAAVLATLLAAGGGTKFGDVAHPILLTVGLQDFTQVAGMFGEQSEGKISRVSAALIAYADAMNSSETFHRLKSPFVKLKRWLNLPKEYDERKGSIPRHEYVAAELRYRECMVAALLDLFDDADDDLLREVQDAVDVHLYRCRRDPDYPRGLAASRGQKYDAPVAKERGRGWKRFSEELDELAASNIENGEDPLAPGLLPPGVAIVQSPGGVSKMPIAGAFDNELSWVLAHPEARIDDPDLRDLVSAADLLFDAEEVWRVIQEQRIAAGFARMWVSGLGDQEGLLVPD